MRGDRHRRARPGTDAIEDGQPTLPDRLEVEFEPHLRFGDTGCGDAQGSFDGGFRDTRGHLQTGDLFLRFDGADLAENLECRRHGRTGFHINEEIAHGAGDGCEHQVVDRTAQSTPHLLHIVERHVAPVEAPRRSCFHQATARRVASVSRRSCLRFPATPKAPRGPPQPISPACRPC